MTCSLEVVDVLRHPVLAEQANVPVTPTLAVNATNFSVRFIGDLSNKQKVLNWLSVNAGDSVERRE